MADNKTSAKAFNGWWHQQPATKAYWIEGYSIWLMTKTVRQCRMGLMAQTARHHRFNRLSLRIHVFFSTI